MGIDTERLTGNSPDMVAHPNHYQGNYGLETKEVIKNFISDYNSYLAGNVIKYACRWDKKNGIEDLQKAKQYIDFLIEELKGADNGEERNS